MSSLARASRLPLGIIAVAGAITVVARSPAHGPVVGPGHGHAGASSALVLPVAAPPATSVHIRAADYGFAPVPGWCQLPDDRPLGNTHGGVVIDRGGRVYFNTDTDRSIVVHEADGTFVRAIASEYAGIHGMILREEAGVEYLYAAHLAGHQVLKLRLDGTLVWALGVPMESGRYDDDPTAFRPTAVAIGPEGQIYVADGYGRNWIHQFTPGLRYVRSFGGRGEEPGRFRTCHGLALDVRGEEPCLLVCDRENRRLQRFDLDGRFLDVAATGLRRPCSVAFSGDAVAVAELEGRVTIMDADFVVLAHVGDNPDRSQWAKNGVVPAAWVDGIFTAPHGCCFDADGNLYVMDWNATGRVSKLRRLRE